jgi:hypothetical protein
MEDMYGASKGPHLFSRAVDTIKLNDFIREFDTLCDMQQLWNPQQFTPFLTWKGLFQHLEGLPMDDYHKYWNAHEADIEE